MDAIGRALRLLPKQISDWLWAATGAAPDVERMDRRSPAASASSAQRIAFVAIWVVFGIVLIPALLLTVVAMVLIRIAAMLLQWLGLSKDRN